jgi:hypothetical protein
VLSWPAVVSEDIAPTGLCSEASTHEDKYRDRNRRLSGAPSEAPQRHAGD